MNEEIIKEEKLVNEIKKTLMKDARTSSVDVTGIDKKSFVSAINKMKKNFSDKTGAVHNFNSRRK